MPGIGLIGTTEAKPGRLYWAAWSFSIIHMRVRLEIFNPLRLAIRSRRSLMGFCTRMTIDIIRNNDIMGGTQHYQNQGLLRRGDTDVLLPRSQTEPSGSACLHQFRP